MMLKKIFFNSKLPVTFGQFIFLYLLVWLAAFTCIREMVIHFFPIFWMGGSTTNQLSSGSQRERRMPWPQLW